MKKHTKVETVPLPKEYIKDLTKHVNGRRHKSYKSGEETLFPLVAKCKRNMKSKEDGSNRRKSQTQIQKTYRR